MRTNINNMKKIESRINDVIKLIDELISEGINIQSIQEHINGLKDNKICQHLKNILKSFMKYKELKVLIEGLTIETYEFDQIDYMIDFKYHINFSDILDIKM